MRKVDQLARATMFDKGSSFSLIHTEGKAINPFQPLKRSQPSSLLHNLTSSEQGALKEWLSKQPGDPKRSGTIDLMRWPGWVEALGRQFKDRFGVDPTKPKPKKPE